jgi:hypothetical protein
MYSLLGDTPNRLLASRYVDEKTSSLLLAGDSYSENLLIGDSFFLYGDSYLAFRGDDSLLISL